MVLDKNDHPCLVWRDAVSDSWEIYFARWNGKMLTNAAGEYFPADNGNVSNNRHISSSPSLVLDENGNPNICWTDVIFGIPGPDMESFEFTSLVRWNGSAWVPETFRQ